MPYEVLVVSGLSKQAAQSVADIINSERCGRNGSRYWMVVEESYALNTEGPA